MPYAEGYKGDAKAPLSSKAVGCATACTACLHAVPWMPRGLPRGSITSIVGRRKNNMNENDQTAELKNKIAQLRQRLNQIYAQYFADTSKSRVFETEFSLYLKACEHARNEISESLKHQYDITRTGLFVLIGASALTFYLFKLYILFGILVFLGFGFCACGFMYLLLACEIKIARASEFCAELENYFQRFRWSTELKESLNLPDIPLWDEYSRNWNKDVFDKGHFGGKALYAPFRLVITLVDLLALAYSFQLFLSKEHNVTLGIFIACLVLWAIAVTLQIFLVDSILNKVDIRLRRTGKKQSEEVKEQGINRDPYTWINIIKLFLLLDLIFPRQTIKDE